MDKYFIIIKGIEFSRGQYSTNAWCMYDRWSKAKVWSIKFFILAIQRVDTLYVAHIIKFQMWHVIEENEN